MRPLWRNGTLGTKGVCSNPQGARAEQSATQPQFVTVYGLPRTRSVHEIEQIICILDPRVKSLNITKRDIRSRKVISIADK